MSRDLNRLLPHVKAKAEAWLESCEQAGFDVLVTCTERTFAEQDKLYAQGRTAPGAIVTNARGGYSMHNFQCAIDFVPMRHGRPVWSYKLSEDKALWFGIGELAEKCGFRWSGRWQGKLREMAHIEDTGGKTLAQLRAGVDDELEFAKR